MTTEVGEVRWHRQLQAPLAIHFDLSQHFTSLKSLVTLTTGAEADDVQEPYTLD